MQLPRMSLRSGRPQPLHGALLLLALLVALGVGMELRDWWLHGPERQALASLRREVVVAGHDLIVTRQRADTLRRAIETHDVRLGERVEELDRFGRRASDGELPHHLWPSYRGLLAEYQEEVARRNALYQEWASVHARYLESLESYRTLADSMLRTARSIGEEYPSIPTPAEAYAEVTEGQQG
jgi:hypothetical protein